MSARKTLPASEAGAVAADEMHLDVLAVAEKVFDACVHKGFYRPTDKAEFIEGFLTGMILKLSGVFTESERQRIRSEDPIQF